MILLNPKKHVRKYADEKSREIMLKTLEFFEKKGLASIKEDDRKRVWYREYLDFIKDNKIFATLLTPSSYSDDPDARWDTYRNCEFNEIIAFYGLGYWYTWQVSILGLGPIWMSGNEELKKKAARALEQGGIFAFGLSERQHGADVYSTEMTLTPNGEGKYLANGEKYYIGNANEAAMVSTFGKVEGTDDYVFFVANFEKPEYELVKNVCDSQNYVGDYALHDYPVTPREEPKDRTFCVPVISTDDPYPVTLHHSVLGLTHPSLPFSVRHQSTSGANDTILMYFFSRSSRPTGPKMRVPRGSPWGLMRTAALSSKRM